MLTQYIEIPALFFRQWLRKWLCKGCTLTIQQIPR